MSQPQQPPQPQQQPPVPGTPPRTATVPPPPGMYQARQPRKMITNEAEKREQARTLIYSLVFIVVVLIVGFVAGVIDQAIHSSSADRNQNYFLLNAQDILLIVASMAPWAVLFFLICVAWTYITNRLFTKWNSALADDENDEAYGKGLVYEIVHDNNAAAALVLIMPMLVIAVALIFIVILIKQ